jgi:hypothetical protein
MEIHTKGRCKKASKMVGGSILINPEKNIQGVSSMTRSMAMVGTISFLELSTRAIGVAA